jgi:tetratricopeptide (TPR) repeat protein
MEQTKHRRFLVIFAIFILLVFSANAAFAKKVTFEREYTYQASEADSKLYCRAIALEQVKMLLLEELGVYLESETEIKDFQLTKDQMTTLTAGTVMTQVLDEKWDGHTYTLRAKIEADTDEVVKSVNSLRKDRQKMQELVRTRKKAKQALKEVEKLKKEIADLKAKDKIEKMKEYDKAVKELSSADWLEKGFNLYQNKEFKASIRAYGKAIKLSPEFTIAYYNRGNIYSKDLGKYQKAIMDYDKALTLNPRYVKAYNNRGLSYSRLGSYQLAIRDYSKAIKLKSDYSIAYLNRGSAYSKLGNYEQAVKDYGKVIELRPQYPKAYELRGTAYKKLGNMEMACSDWRHACELGGECKKYDYESMNDVCD